MKRKFLINPQAGRGKHKSQLEKLKAYMLRSGGGFDSVYSESAEHLREEALLAVRSGYEQIVVVGGDGTVHHVVNGLMKCNPDDLKTISIAIVPFGSGSDYFRSINCKDWKTALLKPVIKKVDVGVANLLDKSDNIFFINSASLGLSAEITKSKKNLSSLVPRKLTYFVPLIQRIPFIELFKADVQLFEKNNVISYGGNYLNIFISKGQYCGGGMKLGPDVRLNDGNFEVTLIKSLNVFSVVSNLHKLFTGKLGSIPGVEKKIVQRISVKTPSLALLELDGESYNTKCVEFKVVRNSLQICT